MFLKNHCLNHSHCFFENIHREYDNVGVWKRFSGSLTPWCFWTLCDHDLNAYWDQFQAVNGSFCGIKRQVSIAWYRLIKRRNADTYTRLILFAWKTMYKPFHSVWICSGWICRAQNTFFWVHLGQPISSFSIYEVSLMFRVSYFDLIKIIWNANCCCTACCIQFKYNDMDWSTHETSVKMKFTEPAHQTTN